MLLTLILHHKVDILASIWTLEDFKNITYIILAAVTITIAIIGFNKWKKELRGKAYFDYSYRFLKQVYLLRDVLHDARGAMFLPAESRESGPPSEDETVRELEHDVSVYQKRHKKVLEVGQEFNSLIAEGEALHGKNFRDTAQKMIKKINDYSYAIDLHLQYRKNFILSSQRSPMPDVWKNEVYPIVHRQEAKGKDSFGDSIDKIVEEIDSLLVRYIRKYRP